MDEKENEELEQGSQGEQAAEEPVIPGTPEELLTAMGVSAEEREAAAPENPRAPADLMHRLRSRLPSGDRAFQPKQLLKPREVSFIIDGSYGAPEFFMDEAGDYYDVELVCRSLDTVQELEALRSVTQPQEAPYMLAKASLYAIEGVPIQAKEKDLIWEAIGSTGRQLCIMAQQALGAASESALGKYRRSFTVR